MIRDVNLYRFLKGAITNKYKNAGASQFSTIDYDPWIYKWARGAFRELRTPEFLNIQDRNVLEKVYERLHVDPRLKPLDDPDLALRQKEYELSEGFHQQLETDKTLAQQTAPPSEQATPTGGPATGEKPTSSRGRMPQARLQHSPETAEPASTMESPTEETHQPAITQKTAPSAQTQPKAPSSRRINFSALKPSASSINKIASPVGIFIKRNTGKVASGLGEIAKGVGRGIAAPAASGAYNLGARAGMGGINTLANLYSQTSRRAASLKRFPKPSGKLGIRLGIAGFLALFLFIFVSSLGGIGGTTTPSETGNVGIGTPIPIPSDGTHPIVPITDPSGLKQKIIDQFGIIMNGYDPDHLKWAWEKLWDVSNTNFINLVRGVIIQARAGSEQVGCPGGVAVYLDQYPEVLFKYGLIHELGHVIRNCISSSTNSYADHLNALSKEGGVTYYAKHAYSCTGSDGPSEDYAEMIALYLNPSANIQMTRCTPSGTSYTNLRTDFPLHYNVARSILGGYP